MQVPPLISHCIVFISKNQDFQKQAEWEIGDFII